jgi:CheY-like chemotaxis protein
MNILFLDDNPNRQKLIQQEIPSSIRVYTAEEAIKSLAAVAVTPEWDYVFLDHDLGGEQYVSSNRKDTGMEVVRWIVANKPKIRMVILHSLNYFAVKEMKTLLTENGYGAIIVPFFVDTITEFIKTTIFNKDN